MNYILTLETTSYTGFADISNNTFIDTDISYDEIGLPMIKSRRMKGLLKESCIEIMELDGKTDLEIQIICNTLFGKKGETEGCIKWSNFYVENYNKIKKEIIQYNLQNNATIPAYFCQSIHTETISSTAIHHTNKSAIHNSLRTIRVLQPAKKLFANINIDTDETSEAFAYFNLAVKNLQEGGINRNRGLGNFILTLEKDNSLVAKNNINFDLENIQDNDTIELVYKTIQPIVIPNFGSDPNTIQSAEILPGNLLRGVFAKSAKNKIELNAILNSGKVSFSFGYPVDVNDKINYPLPYFLHKEKDKENYINLFKNEKNDILTKPVGGLGEFNLEGSENIYTKHEVLKEAGFHNSRDGNDERLKGKNTDGDIFYYEAISANQQFAFTISGKKEYLKEIISVLINQQDVYFGKSKTVQYGHAKLVNLSKKESIKAKINVNKEYILTFLSPTIVLNNYGESMPNLNTIQSYLESAKISKSAISVTEVEIANSLWKTMPLRYRAFGAGSSFLIENIDEALINNWLENGVGEFTDMGFGKIALYENTDYKKKEKTESKQQYRNIELNNEIIKEFEKKETYHKNYLLGFNAGSKISRKNNFNSTMVSGWYDKVKKSGSIENIMSAFSPENLSPYVNKQLENHPLQKHLNEILIKTKKWDMELKPHLLGLFKAMRINAKQKQQNNEQQ